MSAAQTAQQVANRMEVLIGVTQEKVDDPHIIPFSPERVERPIKWGEPVVHKEGTYYSSKETSRELGYDPETHRTCVRLDVDIKEFDRKA